MANRNFDSSAIIQRLQNRIYSRNLYNNNTTGQRVINNPQTTDGNSSRYVTFVAGAQTEYFRTLEGTTMVSEGGTANIPPYPTPPTPSTTVPDAPTIIDIIPGNASLEYYFNPPVSDGGATIKYYEYTTDGTTYRILSFDNNIITVLSNGLGPLVNGETYPIQIRAVNSVGEGLPSNTVFGTPATVPAAPSISYAIQGDTIVTIYLNQEPDGGSPILNYYYSIDDGVSFAELIPEDTVSPITITGLTNGTTYEIRLMAINLIGLSDISNGISVTPSGVPDAPTNLVATPDNTRVSIAFTQGFDGGSAIINYEYSTDDGASFSECDPAVTTSPIIIADLTNGTTYDIKLKAVNLRGPSTASAPVSSTPNVPTIV
jgi:hypothetical protein